MLRTKEKELFFDSRAWTPPHPPAKIPRPAHGFALGTYNHGSIAYRVRNIPVKGLWASSARMRPLTCHLIHEMSFFGLLKVKLLLGWKGRGGYALQSLTMTTL